MAANTQLYAPNQITFDVHDPVQLAQWIQNELQIIGRTFTQQQRLQLAVNNAAPPQPRTALVAYADGTHWNPGQGEGLYQYESDGTWHFIGSGTLTSAVSSIAGNTGAFTLTGGLGNETNALIVKNPIQPEGRLTLATGTGFMSTTVSGATSHFYTPYYGQWCPIYDGTNFINTDTGGELSQLASDTTKSPAAAAANKNYDVFVWNDTGTIRATRGPAWTTDTSRSLGLTRINGIQTNNGAITNGPATNRGTWVGTIRANGSATYDFIYGAAASGGTAASFGCLNYYNRLPHSTIVTDSGASYTYSSATIRQARASAGNQISFLSYAEIAAHFTYSVFCRPVASLGSTIVVGIGVDSTTTITGTEFTNSAWSANSENMAGTSPLSINVSSGWHTVAALEQSDGADANTFDFGGANTLQGLLWL